MSEEPTFAEKMQQIRDDYEFRMIVKEDAIYGQAKEEDGRED